MDRLRKNLIWAVDVDGDASIQAAAASFVKSIQATCDFEPVYVHGASGYPFDTEKEAIRFNLRNVQKKLKKTLIGFGFKNTKDSRILAHKSDFLRAKVKALVSYAIKSGAEAIVVGTQAKTGFARHILGSFAETLILTSTVPVMVVNPKARILPTPGLILFPTDFSEKSKMAFRKVISLAQTVGSQVEIFHQYQVEPDSFPSNGEYLHGDLWPQKGDLLDNQLKNVTMQAENWKRLASKQNVICHFRIRFGLRNISDAVLAEAKRKKVWMIAIPSVTGPMSAFFLGSNARWVVRSAPCPVWVLFVKGK